jgi:ABC transport system ATP-binding/permease protein
MALIDLQNITKKYSSKYILNNINFTLDTNQRIALIGQNGTGKSTLMKIITNDIQIDEGIRSINKDLKIKMLDQNPKFEENITVKQAIQNHLKEHKKAKNEYDNINIQLQTNYNDEKLLLRQEELSSYLTLYNAWDLENMVQKVLKEFDLIKYENTLVCLLSGGEQRRVCLAALLLNKPDILLLDEPTNHLDVYMVEFLEKIIIKNSITILFISHDRYFIDNIATSIIELDNAKLRKFHGGYTQYLVQKEELLQNMQKQHHNLIRLYKEEARWMQTGVSARRKRNERRKNDYLQLKKDIKNNPSQINKIKIQLQKEQKAFNVSNDEKVLNKKKMLFEIKNISKKLGNKILIKDFSTRIVQKDIIAVVGANGSGKSTLLKILLKQIPLDNGTIKQGEFKIGYFDQNRKLLNDDKSIIETFCPMGGSRVSTSDGKDMHVYGYLKNFLFPQEYLDKKIGLLSGGEKNRVALALLFTKKVDCIILDEPTNDLDIPTINILESYLQTFQGAIIIVSHDRYFVDKIAKKLYVFENENITITNQSYTDYLNIQKELKDINNLQKNNNNSFKKQSNTTPLTQKENIKKLTFNEKKEYTQLELEITKYEKDIENIKKCMSDIKCYEEKGIVKLSQELQKSEEIYEKKVNRYLELDILKST